MKFGSPDKKQAAKKNYFSIKKGTQVFRILPPLGDLADKGIWNRYYAIHFGYRTTKGYMRPFCSPEVVNRKTRMVEVRDAAKEYIDNLLTAKNTLVQKLEENPGDLKVQAQLKKTEELLSTFNLEKRYYVNAMDQNGNIGLLKLKTREKNALDAAREQMKQEEDVDPIAVVGAFLTFTKHGDGRDSSVLVSANYVSSKTDTGKTVKSLNTHDLATDKVTISRLKDSAFNLDALFVRPTSEEVTMMVKNGPESVTMVMEKYKSTKLSDSLKVNSLNDDSELEVENKQEESPVSAPPVSAPPELEDDVMPEDQVVSKVAVKVEKSAPVKVSSPSNVKTTSTISDTSDDDFLAFIGVKL